MNYLYWLTAAIWLPTIVLWCFVPGPRGPKIRRGLVLATWVFVTQLPVEFFILRHPMVMGEGNYLGIRFLTFPIEDFLFFMTIPFLVLAVVHLVDDRAGAKC